MRHASIHPKLSPYPHPHPHPHPYQARKNKSTVRMRSSIQPVRHADSPRGGGGGGALTPRRDASGGDGGEPAPLMSQGGDDGRGVGRGSEGDVAPLAVDASVGWDKVGGLRGHIRLRVAGATTHGCRLHHIRLHAGGRAAGPRGGAQGDGCHAAALPGGLHVARGDGAARGAPPRP